VRRRVVHLAGVDAITSWIVVYMVATTYEKLFLPDAVFLTLVAFTFLGFPVVLVLGWYFRLGRGGVRWRRPGAADEGAYADSRAAGNAAGSGLLLFGLLLATGSFLAVANRLTDADPPPVIAEMVAVLPFEEPERRGGEPVLLRRDDGRGDRPARPDPGPQGAGRRLPGAAPPGLSSSLPTFRPEYPPRPWTGPGGAFVWAGPTKLWGGWNGASRSGTSGSSS
jgi:hypothetical protein